MIYVGIKRRTAAAPDKSNARYWKHYGGRGIKMHEPWRGSFKLFEAEVTAECGLRPSQKHSLDRIDNDGHYEPGNLRWATAKVQHSNTRPQIAYRERESLHQRIAAIEQIVDAALAAAA
jgi:hypothetical protein